MTDDWRIKKMGRLTAFLLVVLAPSLAYANAGVFEGSGHTIKLVRSEDIQLRSEEVMIVPGRGPFLFDGGVPGMDRAEYRCKFVLHNRSRNPVTVQVGLPLTSDSLRRAEINLKPDDETALVLWYKFIVRDNEKTYHVRFAPNDEEKKLGTIFLWDMTFQGDEVRVLNVAYEIPMAMGLIETKKDPTDWKTSYAKRWYDMLAVAINERCDYVTVTGQSWAGPIEHAKFTVYAGEFERYLADRYVTETEKPRVNDEHGAEHFDWHIRDRLIHREVGPDGWTEKDGVITWEFTNYRPEKPISISYTLTILPKRHDTVPSFVRSVLGRKPSKEDLSDLREILLAWWGVTPTTESVRQFVSKQRWYSPKDGMTTDKLTTEQKAVISAIEQYHSPTPNPSP